MFFLSEICIFYENITQSIPMLLEYEKSTKCITFYAKIWLLYLFYGLVSYMGSATGGF